MPGIKRVMIISLVLLLVSACGGGGGGSSASPTTPPPPPPSGGGSSGGDGFANGTFAPYANFEAQCEVPRTGLDDEGRPFPDAQGTTLDENNWLRSWSNDLYLWYDEIVDVDPASLPTPDYFDEMKTFELSPSGAPKDKFHFTIPTDEWRALSRGGVSAGYGATFTLISSSPPRQVVVAYTEPDSPATSPAVNLTRGVSILEIDGVDVVNGSDTDTLNAGLFPDENETHTFVIEELDGEIRQITMTSVQVVSSPVQNVSTIETESGTVGYMTFNDHIRPAEAQLVEAIEFFEASGVSDVVLDLRYNGGGFLDIANELSFMLAGPDRATGRVFESMQFNDKHPDFDPVRGSRLAPTLFHSTAQGFSVSSGTPLPSLSLSRLFVLAGSGTCSASESIVNSLRGIDVEVVLIGDTTCGKPYGFYPFDNCGTTYFSIQFRGVNDKNFGDYTDGFSPANLSPAEGLALPGCLVSDDFTKQLGDPAERKLAAALQYRVNEACPAVLSVANARAKPGVHPLSAVSGQVMKPEFLKNRIYR